MVYAEEQLKVQTECLQALEAALVAQRVVVKQCGEFVRFLTGKPQFTLSDKPN